MSAYAVHHDYKNDDEMLHSALDLFYLVCRLGNPEALVHLNGHLRFMIGQIQDKDIIFLRIPAMVYDIQVAFEIFPVKTIDDYLW
jgi:hypothetical protein